MPCLQVHNHLHSIQVESVKLILCIQWCHVDLAVKRWQCCCIRTCSRSDSRWQQEDREVCCCQPH